MFTWLHILLIDLYYPNYHCILIQVYKALFVTQILVKSLCNCYMLLVTTCDCDAGSRSPCRACRNTTWSTSPTLRGLCLRVVQHIVLAMDGSESSIPYQPNGAGFPQPYQPPNTYDDEEDDPLDTHSIHQVDLDQISSRSYTPQYPGSDYGSRRPSPAPRNGSRYRTPDSSYLRRSASFNHTMERGGHILAPGTNFSSRSPIDLNPDTQVVPTQYLKDLEGQIEDLQIKFRDSESQNAQLQYVARLPPPKLLT